MKSNLDQFFKMDDKASKAGVDFEVADGVKFRLLPFRPTNPKVKASMDRHYKPHARQIENGRMSAEKTREVMTRVFVDASVIGWTGVEIDGKKQEFSKELATDFLISLPELASTLMQHAEDFNNFSEEFNEEDLKSLGNS